jgi:hypothetical protein
MRYFNNFRKFAKRAILTSGAVVKGNLLTFGMCIKKSKTVFLFYFRIVILGRLAGLNCSTVLTNKSFKYGCNSLQVQKLNPASKFACGIRQSCFALHGGAVKKSVYIRGPYTQ